MKIRRIDAVGDWCFGRGMSDIVTGQKAIEQNVRTRLLSWKNNCFFALQDGVDWRNRLEKRQQDNLILEIKSMVLASEGVVGMDPNSIEFVLDSTRNFTLKFTMDTIYGQNFQQEVANA